MIHHKKVIEDHLYKVCLCFIVSDDEDKVKRDGNEYLGGFIEKSGYVGGMTSAGYIKYRGGIRECVYIAVNPEILKTNEIHGVLAHEALHAVNLILDNRGVKFDVDNDEPYAYYLSYIVEQFYDFLKEKKCL